MNKLYHSLRYGYITWYCTVCQKANRASERPKPVSFVEAMTNLGMAIAKTDEGGKTMREIFTINYVVGDEVKTFALGQDVFYVSTTYPTISCRCQTCGSIYNEKKEIQRKIIPCTITGFKITANHSFSYNTQNSFVLNINVIHNESDEEVDLRSSSCFTTIEEAEDELKRLSV